jgi:hypothetical protein
MKTFRLSIFLSLFVSNLLPRAILPTLELNCFDALVSPLQAEAAMKWHQALLEIFLDVLHRLHRFHTWSAFVLLGVVLGAMAGVMLTNRTTGMLVGAALGLWMAVWAGRRWID